MCVKLAIYRNYTEMHGQKNIQFCDIGLRKLRSRLLYGIYFAHVVRVAL
jgi:hypothetical protein